MKTIITGIIIFSDDMAEIKHIDTIIRLEEDKAERYIHVLDLSCKDYIVVEEYKGNIHYPYLG